MPRDRRRGHIIEPAATDATASMPEHGKHPFDEMLDQEQEGDSYTHFQDPGNMVVQDEQGSDTVPFQFRQPPRQPTEDEGPPEGYLLSRNGNLVEIVDSRPGGVTQNQYNFFVDLLLSRNLLASPKFFDRVNAMDEDEYEHYLLEIKASVYMGTKANASAFIEALKSLPWKAREEADDNDTLGTLRKFRVKYKTIEVDGPRGTRQERRIGYLTDGETEIPECKFALDTSQDERFTNDVTFFHLWVGDRHGWKLYMYRSDEELPMPVGTAAPVLRVFAADLGDGLARYGREKSRCGICNRKLTKDVSRERGIGPVCAENVGL